MAADLVVIRMTGLRRSGVATGVSEQPHGQASGDRFEYHVLGGRDQHVVHDIGEDALGVFVDERIPNSPTSGGFDLFGDPLGCYRL